MPIAMFLFGCAIGAVLVGAAWYHSWSEVRASVAEMKKSFDVNLRMAKDAIRERDSMKRSYDHLMDQYKVLMKQYKFLMKSHQTQQDIIQGG